MLFSKPQMHVGNPDSIQKQHLSLLIQATKQSTVNNFGHNFGNIQPILERPDAGNHLWFWKMQYYINFTKIGFGTFITDHVTPKCDIFCNKTTFARVQFQVYFFQFEKYSIQMLKMFFPILVVYIEIVNKYLRKLVSQLLKNC